MQRLNSLDAQFIYGEASGWPLHMCSVSVFDAAGAPEGLDLERVRELFRQRLPHIAVFRHRLVRVPGGLDRPVWVEDPDVDVDAHIHGVRLPAPGTDRQLAELVAQLCAPRMDLDQPVWEKWVIEGLEKGQVAVLDRLHHCALDGVRGMQVQEASYDVTPDAPFSRPGAAPGAGMEVPGTGVLLAEAALHLASSPGRVVETGVHAAAAARRLLGAIRSGSESGLALPFSAPRAAFNKPVTHRRCLAFGSLSLPAVKRVAHAEGVTVNDVVLGVVGGGLRRYLAGRGELPDRSLTAAIPVGFADSDGKAAVGGNRFSVMVASLGTDVADPVERLHRITASAGAGKALTRALGADLTIEVAGLLPPAFIGGVSRTYGSLRLSAHHPPLANVIVSDVRGATVPLYLAGARMVKTYPFGPASDFGSLNVTAVSYLDSIDVGLMTCPDVLEDPWLVMDALKAECAELTARYGGTRGGGRRPRTVAQAG